MKLKKQYRDIIFIAILTAIVFVIINACAKNRADNPSAPSVSNKSKSVISDIKENKELVYESTNIKEFTSLVFKSSGKYISYIIDSKTGKTLEINDIIKKDKIKHFSKKEIELLNLKYPSFIVNAIKDKKGDKIYFIKDNEIIIYYYNYDFEYEMSEDIFLKINNNEVKDYLNYTFKLDKTYENEDGYKYDKNKKTIAITFDDGPHKTNNAKILNSLKENKAHATFFMVGNRMKNDYQTILNTYKSGNEVASHTYEHMNMTKKSIEEVQESMQKTDEIFNKVTGSNIRYVRPPYGAYNSNVLQNINEICITWDLDTEDWLHHDADYIVNYVMDNVQDGSIILMHELYQTSAESLDIMLPMLYAKGYQVVTISELINIKEKVVKSGTCYRSFK